MQLSGFAPLPVYVNVRPVQLLEPTTQFNVCPVSGSVNMPFTALYAEPEVIVTATGAVEKIGALSGMVTLIVAPTVAGVL